MMLITSLSVQIMAQDGIPTTPLVKIRQMQLMAQIDEVMGSDTKSLIIESKFGKVDILPCPDTLSSTRVIGKLEAMDEDNGYVINVDNSDPFSKTISFSVPEQTNSAFSSEFTIYLHESTQIKVVSTTGTVNIKKVDKANVEVQTENGKVNIDKVQGVFNITTLTGAISVSNAAGSIKLKSNSGVVNVSDAEGDLSLDSGDGALTVKNIKGNLNTNTIGGKQTIDQIEGNLDLNSKGGIIRMTYVNAELIKASTIRGDISFGNSIKGALDITTGSGTVGSAQAIVLTGSSRFESETGRIKLKFANKKEDLTFDISADTKESAILAKGTSKKKKLQMGNGNIVVTSHSKRGDQIFS